MFVHVFTLVMAGGHTQVTGQIDVHFVSWQVVTTLRRLGGRRNIGQERPSRLRRCRSEARLKLGGSEAGVRA